MNEPRRFTLQGKDPSRPTPVLERVRAYGRLDGVLFDFTVVQTYRNAGDRVLEVVYTFPLPSEAVLLGFASTLGDARQEGVVVARRDAERRYEEALAEGDAPVLLETSGNGLFTANIGNLAPGETIELETRFAQPLRFEQGRLRVAVPTTIAPRYGDAEEAGLQPQHVPVAALDAAYPLELTMTIGGVLAGATIECPTHRVSTRVDEAGATTLSLAGALLDRDVVVLVTPREPQASLVVVAADAADSAAPVVAMAALRPASSTPREQLALKLLVDCSGSMNGDSIASARAALRGVLSGLTAQDTVSLSRFGSTVEHVVASTAAKPQALRFLDDAVGRLEADLGGTEMEAALASVFSGRRSAGETTDVLLVTDGEIWQSEKTIATARATRHRVFAIGVGTSPAEPVLRALAEATGGACEFATPGEALEAAARRMVDRMRQPVRRAARVEWGATPVWTSDPPSVVFGGDTVVAFAGFATPIDAARVRLMSADVEVARGEATGTGDGDALARIAGARRMVDATPVDALALALRYRLVSSQTHCVLVHVRADGEKTDGMPAVHRVAQMLAAGWGGTGSVVAAPSLAYDAISCAAPQQSADIAMFRRTAPSYASLETLARGVQAHLDNGGLVDRLPTQLASFAMHPDLDAALDAVVQLGLARGEAWVLLAHWVNTRRRGLRDARLSILLGRFVAAIGEEKARAAIDAYAKRLGMHPNAGWSVARGNRLQRAFQLLRP